MGSSPRACCIAAAAAVLLTAGLAGCAPRQGPLAAPADASDLAPSVRPLALDSPRLAAMIRGGGAVPPPVDPWYASRNDARLATNAGIESPTAERTFTRTYERQVQHAGRVRDHISVTTYRSRYKEVVK